MLPESFFDEMGLDVSKALPQHGLHVVHQEHSRKLRSQAVLRQMEMVNLDDVVVRAV
jgi:hypothetical protein